MLLGFVHHQLGSLVGIVFVAIPIDNDAIDTAADHVRDLIMDLHRVVRVVADIYVARIAPPWHEVCDHFGIGSGIQQRMNIDFADVPRAQVAIALRVKAFCSTCVVGSLGSERGGGNDLQVSRQGSGCKSNRSCDCQ